MIKPKAHVPLLSWVQPSTCFSCLLRSSLRTELVLRRLQEMNPKVASRVCTCPQRWVRSRGLSICFMFVGFRASANTVSKVSESLLTRRRSLIDLIARGQTGTQRRGQLGPGATSKKATILIGRPRSVFNNSNGFPFSFLFHWKPHEQSPTLGPECMVAAYVTFLPGDPGG